MVKKMKKVAFITGITGQDGSYLAELLLQKNYIVHGLLRRTSVLNVERIQETINKYEKIGKLNLHYMDLTDTSSISNLIKRYKPDEFYNLAAMSHVGISFYTGEATLNINTVASYRILESILKNHKKCKFYQASSSEMFGSTPPPQNEKSSFNPQSPYGISKVAAFHTTKYFRQAHGLFASNGILFNHESPRRGPTFVTKKIVQGLVRVKRNPVPKKNGDGYTKQNTNVIIDGPWLTPEEMVDVLGLDSKEDLNSYQSLKSAIEKNYPADLTKKILDSFADNKQIQDMGVPKDLQMSEDIIKYMRKLA